MLGWALTGGCWPTLLLRSNLLLKGYTTLCGKIFVLFMLLWCLRIRTHWYTLVVKAMFFGVFVSLS